MKKTHTFAVFILVSILLFVPVSSCLSAATTNQDTAAYQQSRGAIITVDDDGDGDYTSIKEAVNNANAGDTIEVYSGTYYESNISITKPDITLQGIPYELGSGNATGKPYINGQIQDDVIVIWADNTTVDGFHIENYYEDMIQGGIRIPKGDRCIISHNDIYACWGLIQFLYSSNSSILDNNLSHSDTGVRLHDCTNITISGNTLTEIGRGILLDDGTSYTMVTRNKINDCLHGIQIWSGNNNTIVLNQFESNNEYGLGVLHSYNTVIKQNNFINNKGRDAVFYISPPKYHYGGPIIWSGNYWNRTMILPKIIFGNFIPIIEIPLWINIDWRPALKPYDI